MLPALPLYKYLEAARLSPMTMISARPRSEMRYELKYLLRREQLNALVDDLSRWLRLDTNGNAQGIYPITSLYYDTPDYKAYWDKLDGQRSRRKVRVRVYGDQTVTPETHAYLEVKQRVNKLMRKRRVALDYATAIAFDDFPTLAGERNAHDAALLQEVYYLYRTLQLRPTCVVAYERMAFEGDAFYPDLRVTVDTNLRGRTHDLSLLATGTARNQSILGSDYAVLEVKANHNIPNWLAGLLSRHRCTFYRISKYCLVLEKSKAIAGRQRVRHAVALPATLNSAEQE